MALQASIKVSPETKARLEGLKVPPSTSMEDRITMLLNAWDDWDSAAKQAIQRNDTKSRSCPF
jgi:hypothetical protein